MILRKLILIVLAFALLGLAGTLVWEWLSSGPRPDDSARVLSTFFFTAVLALLAGLALLLALRGPGEDGALPSEGEQPQQ
ncbi:hypothetical protein [Primorskyibacter sp. 2E233]|uniref:hypothetical protein n=1 Tax=Primorskyibacter sp. 2E233 TaxID=3413431 RepID=UPI003BF2097D